MIHPTNPTAVRVKREGPRGWHWIAAPTYNPDIHELIDEQPKAEAVPKKRGRPSKHVMETDNGDC